MWRLNNDRGAVAVLVAILMVALLGFAAVGVDIANMAAHKQQLQNGADAGALAVAQDCAAGNCGDATTYNALARDFAVANRSDGATNLTIDGTVIQIDETVGRVTVRTEAVTDHWFAQFLGRDSSRISAEATAQLVPLGKGTATLPLAISLCEMVALSESGVFEFDELDGYKFLGYPDADGDGETDAAPSDPVSDWETTIYLSKTTTSTVPSPTESSTPTEGSTTEPEPSESPTDDPEVVDVRVSCRPEPSGNWLSGGFGWLDTAAGTCGADVAADGTVSSDTGVDVPSACTVDYLKAMVAPDAPPISIPIFDTKVLNGTGTKATYTILGWAGFKVTGYSFVGQYKEPDGNPPCTGNDRCIRGYFTEAFDASGTGDLDNADLGANVVQLVLP